MDLQLTSPLHTEGIHFISKDPESGAGEVHTSGLALYAC